MPFLPRRISRGCAKERCPSLSIRFRRLPDPDDIALLCLRVRHDEKGVFQLSSSRFERLDFGLVIAHISEISIPSQPNLT